MLLVLKLKEILFLNFGNLSILSFHATKVFNTIEGGAICYVTDEKTKKRIDHLKNFGFVDEVTIVDPGINGKMNEVQAAMGLIQLKYIDRIIKKREILTLEYRKHLSLVSGIKLMDVQEDVEYNYAYFPILVDNNYFGTNARDGLYSFLKTKGIFSRRYFYPLISNFPTYKELHYTYPQNLPVAKKVAEQVLCLPIYPALDLKIVKDISELISSRFHLMNKLRQS